MCPFMEQANVGGIPGSEDCRYLVGVLSLAGLSLEGLDDEDFLASFSGSSRSTFMSKFFEGVFWLGGASEGRSPSRLDWSLCLEDFCERVTTWMLF